IATFSVEIQAIVFIPRNGPFHPFGQPSGHLGKRPCPFQKRERRRRETAGGFQGNGGSLAIRTGKRLAAGRETGTSRYREREGRLREYALFLIHLKSAGIGEPRG
ncbi:hypothetical protein EU579_17860, partial [Salmonella enterica]|nr:hypothetical protein [Salmonella enterica]